MCMCKRLSDDSDRTRPFSRSAVTWRKLNCFNFISKRTPAQQPVSKACCRKSKSHAAANFSVASCFFLLLFSMEASGKKENRAIKREHNENGIPGWHSKNSTTVRNWKPCPFDAQARANVPVSYSINSLIPPHPTRNALWGICLQNCLSAAAKPASISNEARALACRLPFAAGSWIDRNQ